MIKRFRIGNFLYYQHDPKFLFWTNDTYISIWRLKIAILWSRTFVWSDKTFKKWVFEIAWVRKDKYKKLLSRGTRHRKNCMNPDKCQAEIEMENYYNHF